MIPVVYKLYFTGIFLSALYFLYTSFQYNLSIYLFLLCFFTIHIYYTFGEYIIHKYFFHKIFKNIHQKHHEDPKKYYRLFIPIKITLINELILFCVSYFISYYLFGNIFILYPILSSAHFSYLLFEFSHYISHYYSHYSHYLFPKRVVSFHNFHHINDNYHFGFTTPFWDIVFGTCKNKFDFTEYPLSFIPLSIVSFLHVEQIVVLSNIFYIYPSFICYQYKNYGLCLFYFLTGMFSFIYHSYNCFWTKVLDYTFAITYLFVSCFIFISNTHLLYIYEPYIWFLSSILIYLYDKNEFTHIIWHILTSIGVGRMLSFV
jgi:hypothetical protein